jgi:GAF domain-containing protein
VTIHVYDEEDQEFVLRSSSQHPSLHDQETRFRADKTLPGLAVAERRTVSLFEERDAKTGGLRAEEHVFPLEAEGRCLGTVMVVQVAAEQLSKVRLDRARRAVLRFAAALSTARREEALSLRMGRLSGINEFGVILLSTLKPEDVPALATAMTSFIMGTEGCLLRLREEQTPESAVRDAHGLRDAASSREILKLEELASEQVLRSGEALLVREVARDERFRDCTSRVTSFICCPINSEGKTLGCITLFNKDPESALSPARFSRDDLEVLQPLVRYIGKAVANATRFARSRELTERDELTGLPDGASFRTRLLTEISRARRFQLRIAIVTCELLSLPGTAAGPPDAGTGQMLQQIAQAIRAELRDYDTVARVGERTFGIILPQVQNGTGSPVARIRTAIDREVEKHRLGSGAPDLQVRFTHATFPDDGVSGEEMLERLGQRG